MISTQKGTLAAPRTDVELRLAVYLMAVVGVLGALFDVLSASTSISIVVGMTCLMAVWGRAHASANKFIYSPIGLGYCYLVLNCTAVPILWDLHYADPWLEIIGIEGKITLAGVVVMLLATGAILMSTTPAQPNRRVYLTCDSHRLNAVLLICLASGGGGLLIVSILAGGFENLLSNLMSRRAILQSTGPLLVLVHLSAAAVVLGISTPSKKTISHLLVACNLGTYIAACLSMGNRFQALIVLLAALVAYERRSRVSTRMALFLVLPVIPLSVLYVYKVRQGLSYGASQGQIETSSVSSFLYSVLTPFVQGGLDVLRTLGAVFYASPLLDDKLDTLVGSLVGAVPRALWPGKPPGSSLEFSAAHFPRSWAQGTGVPPSLPAELIFMFGLLGGLAIFTLGILLLARATHSAARSGSIFFVILYPLLAADCIVLMKSGIDSFLKLFVLHCVAAWLLAVMSNSAKVTVTLRDGDMATQRGSDACSTT